LKVSKNIKL